MRRADRRLSRLAREAAAVATALALAAALGALAGLAARAHGAPSTLDRIAALRTADYPIAP